MEVCLEYILIKWLMLMSDAFAHCLLSEVKNWKIVQSLNLRFLGGGKT